MEDQHAAKNDSRDFLEILELIQFVRGRSALRPLGEQRQDQLDPLVSVALSYVLWDLRIVVLCGILVEAFDMVPERML